jgi:hypothetical protein
MEELLPTVGADRLRSVIGAQVGQTVRGRYLHWDDLRRRKPPGDLSAAEWWLGVMFARGQGRKQLPFTDTSGVPFTYVFADEALELLHRVDRYASGRIQAPEMITNEATRDRYLVSSLMEEATASARGGGHHPPGCQRVPPLG